MPWRKDSLFNKYFWENGYLSVENWNKVHVCYPVEVSTQSELRIKVFNIRPETLKLVQERVRNTLEAIGRSNDFLSRTQLA
jgi:ribosomal protein L4